MLWLLLKELAVMTHEADLGEDGSFYLIIWKHVHRVCNQVAHKLIKLLSCWL